MRQHHPGTFERPPGSGRWCVRIPTGLRRPRYRRKLIGDYAAAVAYYQQHTARKQLMEIVETRWSEIEAGLVEALNPRPRRGRRGGRSK